MRLILMLLAINIGIVVEGRADPIPIINATPQVYAKPGQWFVWSPAEHLAPHYRVTKDTLVLESRGSDNCIGKWAIELTDMKPGNWYRIGASYQTHDLEQADRSVIGVLSWTGDARRSVQQDYLLEAGASEEWRRIEQTIQMPEDATKLEIGLYLRWAATGSVSYRDITVAKAEPTSARKVKLGVVNYKPHGAESPEASLAQYEPFLEKAAALGADIVCLGETIEMAGSNIKPLEAATELDGPHTRWLGEHARKHQMYIVTSLNIRKDKRVHNMAVLIDREGKIEGTYNKVHLPFAETLNGVIPGNEFPVFETDFGKVGMQICYDNFFPETARSLAQNGAEIIFLPIWGDGRWNDTAWETVSRARAIDNSVYFVGSRYGGGRSLIIDPTGKILEDSGKEEGVFVREVDLNASTRNQWLSVRGRGEWKHLFDKERRPETYRALR
jgi:predicted amidohydrolase